LSGAGVKQTGRKADLDGWMPLKPTVEEQELLAGTLERDSRRLVRREVLAEALVAGGFVVAAVALLALQPPHSLDLGAAAIATVALAVATRVRFYVSSGFTLPTQLAYVPLAFAVPVALGPVCVLLAFLLAAVPDVLAGRARPRRALLCLGNSWFSIGPAAVFAVAGVRPSAASATVLLAALLAQLGGDFAVSSLRDMLETGAPARVQLRETWVYGVDAALSPVGLVLARQAEGRPLATAALLPLLAVFAFFARERLARLEGLIELKDAYHGTALLLGDVIEADDGYTGEHSRGVVQLALAVGAKLGLDPGRLRDLEFGALLHDIGKVAIPKAIINKPDKLDPSEWLVVKTHTVEGQRMLERVGGVMSRVGQIVRSHHERWDGDGYPDGLSGEGIPIESRIVTCCDAWNAMRTNRAYRDALPRAAAEAELRACSGHQFDPRVVDALLAVVGEDAVAADSELDRLALSPPFLATADEPA
jgi:putative nucleotidyltransferase with HDIG domain